jgi:hypothetical protein
VALPLNQGLTIMDVETGTVRYRIAETRSGSPIAASPDGRLLAAWHETKAKDKPALGIWETASGKEVATVMTASSTAAFALMSDNRHLVAADRGLLRVWDLATGKECLRWSLPEMDLVPAGGPAFSMKMDLVTRLVLSFDGRRAFTALYDGTALVWDLQPALRQDPPLVEKPGDKELADWWADLRAEDARHAYAALWGLSEAPEAALPFLRRHLKPATDADVKEVRRLLADLESEAFATREQVFEQLARLGLTAEPALRQALENKPTLEKRRRMQLLLEKIQRQPAAGESLRLLRAILVLEKTGPEGRRLLRELAQGAEGAWLTHAAETALKRMDAASRIAP